MNFEIPKSITVVRHESAAEMIESSPLPFATSPPPPSSLSLSLNDTPPRRPARRSSVGMNVDLGKIEVDQCQIQQQQQQYRQKYQVRTDESGDSDYGFVNKLPSSFLSSPPKPPLSAHRFLSTQRSDSCLLKDHPNRLDIPASTTRRAIVQRLNDDRSHPDNNQIDPFVTTIATPRRISRSWDSGSPDGSNHSRWSSASPSPSSHLPPRMPKRKGGGTEGIQQEQQFVMRVRKPTSWGRVRLVDEHAISVLGPGQN
eukprot:CAMPEP_0113478656 /NCGR_PEP_ID=MMETSP0014_2-20120614/20875_1 /TAXON_ID=2857 /ORGANISM="Nitzschia sp." /LENGTH=255 /DNA_ID=CAMNT_0000371867 /DNA_START=130 /DNA_END=897 /DNA_ORIENTATION=+ /assembly_acc=CAM_ASM_000159